MKSHFLTHIFEDTVNVILLILWSIFILQDDATLVDRFLVDLFMTGKAPVYESEK
ncbi:MAG: hypothetical protein WCL57_06505 [Chloroflexota bacterium]|jgi:hypothetical protein|nr:hypothetical protein [Chloroflexota bacterium]